MLAEEPVGLVYDRIRLKGQGFADEMFDAKIEIHDAIATLSMLLGSQPELEIKAADTEVRPARAKSCACAAASERVRPPSRALP
eukprot:3816208-Prymnesium_polylepis.1